MKGMCLELLGKEVAKSEEQKQSESANPSFFLTPNCLRPQLGLRHCPQSKSIRRVHAYMHKNDVSQVAFFLDLTLCLRKLPDLDRAITADAHHLLLVCPAPHESLPLLHSDLPCFRPALINIAHGH
jgi:hypothetical protein